MIEKFGIQGSGDSFLDAMNQIYERGNMPQLTTKESKDVLTKLVHTSILGCTTKEKWAASFVKTNSESSGFFQRLNIIASSEEGRVANWVEPDLSALADAFVRKIQPLEYQKVIVMRTPEAIEMFEKWFAAKREEWKELSLDVTGRINVQVQRNASHLAWLMGGFHWARIWHFVTMWAILGFVFGHLIMVALHGWSNFVSMLTGWKKNPEY